MGNSFSGDKTQSKVWLLSLSYTATSKLRAMYLEVKMPQNSYK